MKIKEQQETFIIDWCKNNTCISVLDEKFHDAFYKKFGGTRHICYWGAMTVYKAMKRIRKMHKNDKLNRRPCGLSSNWQPGFPKWCYMYSLSQKGE